MPATIGITTRGFLEAKEMTNLRLHVRCYGSTKRLFLVWCLAALGSCCAARAADRPVVTLNEAEFRDRVLACWQGKCMGGTLGMPVEGQHGPHQLTYYQQFQQGEKVANPAPNDDLDLQILWLKALEERGRVDARILGEYWLKYVPVDWNEYGVGKRNMRAGLWPPVSGEFDNAQWKHSNGAFCRTEIWACLAPGCPALPWPCRWRGKTPASITARARGRWPRCSSPRSKAPRSWSPTAIG